MNESQSMGPSQPGVIAPWLLITFIIVLLGGIGYFGWYFWGQGQTKTATPTATTTDQTADWKTYVNAKYGFSMQLNDSLKGYKIKESGDSSTIGGFIDFYLPTSDSTIELDKTLNGRYSHIFGIAIYTPEQWTKVEESGGGIQATDFKAGVKKFQQNSKYIFAYSESVIKASDLKDKDFKISTILSTFQFTP